MQKPRGRWYLSDTHGIHQPEDRDHLVRAQSLLLGSGALGPSSQWKTCCRCSLCVAMPPNLLSRALAIGSFPPRLSRGLICLSKLLLLSWLGLPKSVMPFEAIQGQQVQLESSVHGGVWCCCSQAAMGLCCPGQPAPTTSHLGTVDNTWGITPFPQCL